MYTVVEKHEEYSNLEYEDFDEDEKVYDFEEKILAQLNLKLLKKVEEKKWLFDKIFNGWLSVLELKKKFLFELWSMKQKKKKKDSGEHYEYFIPYYTSTYKPQIPSKSYTYESGYGHEAGYHSPAQYKDDHHIANDENVPYVADKHEKDDIYGNVDHQTENPNKDNDRGYQSPDYYGDDHHIAYDENDIVVKHEEDYDQYTIVDKLKLKAYENPFQVQDNFNEEIGDSLKILEENVSSGLSNNGEHLIPFFTPTNKPNLEDPLRVTEKIKKEENSIVLSSNDEYIESLVVPKLINEKSPKDSNSKAVESYDGSSSDTRETSESKFNKASSDSNSLKPASSDSSGVLSSLQNFLN